MDLTALEQKGQMLMSEWKMRRKTKRLQKENELENHEFIRQVAKAKQSLKSARDNFNFITDNAMMEYYIYMIKAEETKLNYYLSLAKSEGRENPEFFTPHISPDAERRLG